ncbi:MAG: type II secretion system protein [Planctomycetota bacterium]
MPRSRSQSGYTLIEVLIVVTILGIATAVVVPNLLQAGTLGVQAAARVVVADILYAQNDAMTRNATRRVVFVPADNGYSLTDSSGTLLSSAMQGGADQNYAIDFDDDERFRGVEILSADFGGTPVLQFDDLGTPIQGGVVELRYDQQTYRVTVAAFTGRVTVARIDGAGG